MEPLRLNKYLAQCGVASRRGADALIAAGRVAVNGKTVSEAGTRIDPDADAVQVDGRPVHPASATGGSDEPLTILLHKPVQVVTTAKDPQGRTTVFDLLPADLRRRRLFHVGRLDFFSEGLLLLTTDGDLCHRLTHPASSVPKVYLVRVKEKPTSEQLAAMTGGMRLAEGEQLAPVEVRTITETDCATMLEMTLRQGVNRQIRRMCRDLGLTILTLRRVRQGPVSLGDLPLRKWRRLTAEETAALRRAAGLS